MLVKDVMNANVKTATPETRIGDVAFLMCFNKISGVPVVDDDGRIIGIISEKDILFGMYPAADELLQGERWTGFEDLEMEYRDVINLRVGELMTRNVITVPPDVPILRAASIMFLNKIRRVPVAVDGRLVGILSIGDVHKAIFKENLDRQLRPAAEDYGRVASSRS